MGEGHSNTTGHGSRGPTGGVKGGPTGFGTETQTGEVAGEPQTHPTASFIITARASLAMVTVLVVIAVVMQVIAAIHRTCHNGQSYRLPLFPASLFLYRWLPVNGD